MLQIVGHTNILIFSKSFFVRFSSLVSQFYKDFQLIEQSVFVRFSSLVSQSYKDSQVVEFPVFVRFLIVPDQKVVVGAWLKVVVHGGERTSKSAGPNEGCVPADTLTLKSVDVQNGGFQSAEDSTFEAARSLLFIEVGKCRAVIRHTCDRRLRNRKKCNRR